MSIDGEARWRKSSASITGSCVEVAFDKGDVLLRDSKAPAEGTLRFNGDEWKAFLVGVRQGEFDQA